MSQRFSQESGAYDYLASQGSAIGEYVGGKRFYKKKRMAKSVKSAKGVPAKVVKFVKRSLANATETKRFTYTEAMTLGGFGLTVAQFSQQNMLQLTPSNQTAADYQIIQGTSQGARIGNSITVMKATLKYALYPTAYNVTSNPTPKCIDIRCFIVSMKGVPNGQVTKAQLHDILTNTCFANGATSNGMTNNMYDLVQAWNTDVLTVYSDFTLKLGQAGMSGNTGSSAIMLQANNDYKLNHVVKLDITKYLPKKITFNDADTNSTSRQVFLVWAPINFDGTTIPSTTLVAGGFVTLDLFFKDA